MEIKAKIFIVEDESIVALDMQSSLESLGYNVLGIASNGYDALKKIKETVPDLVLMDVHLKGSLDGVQVAEEVRKINDIPIIYITAFADEVTINRAKENDAYGYILKPFQAKDLTIAIDLALYKHKINVSLKENRLLLNQILNSVNDAVIAIDAKGNILFANEIVDIVFSVDRNKIIGSSFDFVFSINKVIEANKLHESNDVDIQVVEIKAKSGKQIIAQVKYSNLNLSNPIKVITIHDVTNIYELEKIKSQMAGIVKYSNDAIYSINTKAQVVSWNIAANEMYGLDFESIKNTSVWSLFNDDSNFLDIQNKILNIFVDKKPISLETLRLKSDGTLFHTLSSFSPIFSANLEIIEIAIIEKDISKQKKYEESLEIARKLAEEANTAKTEFLSNISHELKTPLNSIIGMTELFMDQMKTEDDHEAMCIIRNSAESLLDLINSILDFTKFEAGKIELRPVEFDIIDLLENCMNKFIVQASKKNVQLNFLRDMDIPLNVKADSKRIKQIVENLVSNAVKFTDSGSILIELKRNDNIYSISVQDTGIGIPDDKIQYIFERFTQLDGASTRSYGGTGLGLPIAKNFALLLGGEIIVSSQKGIGSCFTLLVPIEQASLVKSNEKTQTGIVYLDLPSSLDRSYLRELLLYWGFEVKSLELENITKDLSLDFEKSWYILTEESELYKLIETSDNANYKNPKLRERIVLITSINSRLKKRFANIDIHVLNKPVREAKLYSIFNGNNIKQKIIVKELEVEKQFKEQEVLNSYFDIALFKNLQYELPTFSLDIKNEYQSLENYFHCKDYELIISKLEQIREVLDHKRFTATAKALFMILLNLRKRNYSKAERQFNELICLINPKRSIV